MQRNSTSQWVVVLLIMVSLPLAACGQGQAAATKKEAPYKLEQIAGSDLSRVILTEKAAQRLGIQSAPVREEQIVRKRTVGGEIVEVAGARSAGSASPTSPAAALVRVRLSEGELGKVDRAQPAVIMPLTFGTRNSVGADVGRSGYSPGAVASTGVADVAGMMVRPVAAPAVGDSESAALYYSVDASGAGVAPGQRVFVQLSEKGGGLRKLIPYAAVLYDVTGATWAYASSDRLTFVRQRISVDYVDGEQAVLLEGPPTGTAVVTVGATELYGAETGVGK